MNCHHLARRTTLATALILPLAAATPAGAAAAADALADLSLDELMGMTITSASKKEQKADEVASAIFVLTRDDIRRSGATSIPEALRLVPGIQVAQVSANSWAITSRGFNARFASKLLVLIDGRSVYTPLFSGVYWDVQDTLLEDVERVEVIRGPGATVWGANAVNGVINIITRSAKDTHGAYAHVAGGNEEQANVGLRWGNGVGDHFHYRAYAKYSNRDAFQLGNGDDAGDGWDVLRGGFRADWNLTEKDLVTFQGDYYDGEAGQTSTFLPSLTPIPITETDDQQLAGGNFLGRWTHTFSEDMDFTAQIYYDRTERTQISLNEVRDTFDFEFQHQLALPFNQTLIWGGGYRYTQDDIDGTFATELVPEERHDDTFSLFVQDEIGFFDDRLQLVFGTKIENNDYTGWEYQPSLRILAKPHEQHTLWASVSRAVRVPSRVDQDIVLNSAFEEGNLAGGFSTLLGGVPCAMLPFGGVCPDVLIQVVGADDEFSERLYAFEAGYRTHFLDRFTLDIAAFYNEYNYLATVRPGSTIVDPFIPIPQVTQQVFLANRETAENYGVEVDFRADLTDWWRLIVGYSYLYTREGFPDPTHWGSLRSQMDLPFDLELDAVLYLVGNLGSSSNSLFGAATPTPSYERLDLRLAWQPTEHWEIEVVGQNLTERRHPEFPSEIGLRSSEVQRAVYAQVTFRH